MTRWMKFAGAVINRTPILLITPLLMIAAWSAAAQIYAVVIQVSGHGEFAGLVLVGLNVLCSWLLVFNLAGLVHDMQELRLPGHGQLLAVGVLFIGAFIFVAPCVLVWSLNGGARDISMVAMGSFAGTGGALLWRFRARERTTPVARISFAPVVPWVPAHRPNPWRAVRVALGPPFAPATWERRAVELALLCAAVACAPILALLYKTSLLPRAFPFVLHATQFTGYSIAVGLCWIWPLARLLAIFNPERGALTELALLPGLGSGSEQQRRLYLVALGVPAAGLLLLLISALVLVTLQHLPHGVYVKLVAQFLLIPLATLPILIGRIVKPGSTGTGTGTMAVIMASQTWTFSILVWSSLWDAPDSVMIIHIFRRLVVGLVLIGLMTVAGVSSYSLRKLRRRPHPFVEV